MGSGASKDDGWMPTARVEQFQADLTRRDSDGDLFRPQRVLRSGSFGALKHADGDSDAPRGGGDGEGGGEERESRSQLPFQPTTPGGVGGGSPGAALRFGRSASMLSTLCLLYTSPSPRDRG